MKPDLGLRYLRGGYRPDLRIFFYGLPFRDIGFLAPHSYSVMFEYPLGDDIYALSFDFSDDLLACLLSKLPPSSSEQFGSALIGRGFPFRAALPVPVTAEVVECHLGAIQRGAHDEFVSFVITSIE